MNLQDALDIRGRLTVQKQNVEGEIIETIQANNSIVLSGRDLVAKLFINQPINQVSHVAVGKGSTAVTSADAALESEVFRKAINPIDPSQHITTTNTDKRKVMITTELDFAEANDALTEAGLFNAASGGVMYNRVVFPPINKTADFKLTLIWEIIF
jgi:hypothetical protein